MKRRQQSVIYEIAVSESPVTAEELARRLGVSSRTIKADMVDVREELSRRGAVLKAKRNEGYSIEITDPDLFHEYFEPLGFQSALVSRFGGDDETKFFYIARKLTASSQFVKLEDIADELYTSRSTLREAVRQVMEFLKSYHLETESKPGFGIRAFGTEYHVRMAMTELFAVHFHKVMLDNAGMEYARWTECDYEERQEIRHLFLKVLRKSRIRVTDMNAQRLAIYLIIARNRCKAGYGLKLPGQWAEELRDSEEWKTAAAVYMELENRFKDFDLPTEETVFLAVCLLCSRDLGAEEQLESEYPLFFEKACCLEKTLISYMREKNCLDLSQENWILRELRGLLVITLAERHFKQDGFRRFSCNYENQTLKSPVAAELGAVMEGFLAKELGGSLSQALSFRLTALMYKVIFSVTYEVKKQKLLLVSVDGMSQCSVMKQRIMRRYGDLIESCTPVELYEIRELDQRRYDGVLMDSNDMAYHYDLPFCTVHTLPDEKDMEQLLSRILIQAYQFEQWLPSGDQIVIHKNYTYESEKKFLQQLATVHGRITGKYRMQKLPGSMGGHLAVLFDHPAPWGQEYLELFCLESSGTWEGESVRYILYVCVDWQFNWRKVKTVEQALRQMAASEENAALVDEKGREGLIQLVRMNF